MHAWYSNKHDLMYGVALYERLAGQPYIQSDRPIATTMVHSDRERGEKYIKEHLTRFPDYVYIGEVGKFLWNDDPWRADRTDLMYWSLPRRVKFLI